MGTCRLRSRLALPSSPCQTVRFHQLLVRPWCERRALHDGRLELCLPETKRLELTALHTLELKTIEPSASSPPWDIVARQRAQSGSPLAEYARASFAAGRPLIEAALDLMQRIGKDLRYDAGTIAEEIAPAAVLDRGRGICRDFANVGIGCLRELGLSARYVGGYAFDAGAASGHLRLHAWLALHTPAGWIDLDPTPGSGTQRRITMAWGRSAADVRPLEGEIAGGDGQRMESVSTFERVED